MFYTLAGTPTKGFIVQSVEGRYLRGLSGARRFFKYSREARIAAIRAGYREGEFIVHLTDADGKPCRAS